MKITSSNLNTFPKYFHSWKVCSIFNKSHIIFAGLNMLLHYFGKLKSSNLLKTRPTEDTFCKS